MINETGVYVCVRNNQPYELMGFGATYVIKRWFGDTYEPKTYEFLRDDCFVHTGVFEHGVQIPCQAFATEA
jgi:hypothetical protein